MMVFAHPDPWIQRERERVRRWRSARSLAGREIGRLPPVADPNRKRAAARSLKLFCQYYFPQTFAKPFSEDHEKVIATMERAVLQGGLFALAMPRGSGKTSLCIAAALWAVLYGHHQFVLLVGATGKKGGELLRSIKTELKTNPLLVADFPEACFPIHALEGINNRAAGQRFNGQPTFMGWTKEEVVLPTIPGSMASGAIIAVAGILTASRGAQYKRPDGSTVRPSLIIADDPQTHRSAKSVTQCEDREIILKNDLLRSAGPGEKMTMIVPCTVIAEGDLADRLLNRDLNPLFSGIRTKTIYEFPTNMAMWERYWELRAEGFRRGDEGAAATEMYRENRKPMDAGAQVAWEHRVEPGDLSALQTAMNVYLSDPRAFGAEYQNEPVKLTAAVEIRLLTAIEITEKLNHLARGVVPAFGTIVNAKIDVSQDVLWWTVAAWGVEFDGALLDYGTWPSQDRAYFTLTNLQRTIADELEDAASLEEQIYEALARATDELLSREFHRADGAVMRIGSLHVDAGWQGKTIKKFCRESKHAALLLPSHGRGVRAKDRPISEWAKQEGERRGEEWVIRRATEARGLRHLTFDSNHWKTELHKRLATHAGGRASLALFGDRSIVHRMLADHLVAEKADMVEANGRKVLEWQEQPHKPDNHWLDCLVGCAVGASIEGAEVLSHRTPPRKPRAPRTRPRVSYLD